MDNKSIIKSKVVKPLGEIVKVCKENQIPFFFAIPMTDDGEKTEYFSEILSPAVAERELADDKITRMLNVMNGFETIPPRESFVVNF